MLCNKMTVCPCDVLLTLTILVVSREHFEKGGGGGAVLRQEQVFSELLSNGSNLFYAVLFIYILLTRTLCIYLIIYSSGTLSYVTRSHDSAHPLTLPPIDLSIII